MTSTTTPSAFAASASISTASPVRTVPPGSARATINAPTAEPVCACRRSRRRVGPCSLTARRAHFRNRCARHSTRFSERLHEHHRWDDGRPQLLIVQGSDSAAAARSRGQSENLRRRGRACVSSLADRSCVSGCVEHPSAGDGASPARPPQLRVPRGNARCIECFASFDLGSTATCRSSDAGRPRRLSSS